jgi:hypothetical protein
MRRKTFDRSTLAILVVTLSFATVHPVLGQQAATDMEEPRRAGAPDPIRIDRTGGPPRIPFVDRDKVICFALYTVDRATLKLSAQLYPLQQGESREVQLQIMRDGEWTTVGTELVDETGWMATFRVADWDATQAWNYRVTHPGGAVYGGVIRRDPQDKDEIVVAAFTGNSNSDRGPREDIIRNIKHQDPDLLFFSGDQSYDHQAHTAAWLLFGRQFGEIIKDRPTITIPDDHDVGQGNVWGERGKKALLPGGADGGYIMSPEYVNLVQRAQTSHLPDPYDATPVDRGIGVYYTSMNVGGIDFAIIEDRKWKTGPAGVLPKLGPRPDHVTDPAFDRRMVDVPEAELLGARQLQFLNEWGQHWEEAEFKVVLSQTIFAGGAHIHGQNNSRLVADLDSNGWPQSGRDRALRELRRCFALHIAGDQHLATVIHHGTNSWEDAGYSFCVPSIVNFYGRWWWPLEEAQEHDPASPLPFTGRYYDGLGNKVTMKAYANPTSANHNAAGYGIVRLRKSTGQIVMECWPRHVDVSQSNARQHAGWPVTIERYDNYGREAIAWLPTLRVAGAVNPIVQVIDEQDGEIVYTLRIQGNQWIPKVFRAGSYTIKLTAQGITQVFSQVQSTDRPEAASLDVAFTN